MKLWVKLLLLYVLLIFVVGYAFLLTLDHFKADYLVQRATTQQTAYSAALQSNRLMADTFFNEIINQPGILVLVQKIVSSEGAEQKKYRGLLYRSLATTYKRTKGHVAEILHFHFPNNRSMLRFHLPSVSGDDLTIKRPSIQFCNSLLHEVHGYENGRVFHGYRHVYPLFYQNKHIGSVEISHPYPQIYKKVQQLETAIQTQFVFFHDKELVSNKLFKDDKQLYFFEELHPNLVRQKLAPQLYTSTDTIETITDETTFILEALKNNTQTQEKLLQNLDFSQYTKTVDGIYSVVFYAIKNVSGKAAGYLLGITPEPHIQGLTNRFFIAFTLSAIALLWILLYRWTLQTQLVDKKKSQESLQAFFDNKLVAMVQLDAQGNYTQVNHQWEIMTGYSRDELLGRNYIDLTYPEDIDKDSLLIQLANSHHQHALQRIKRYVRKDGTAFWANLSGTGLYNKEDQFVGFVGMISDITEHKQAEEELLKSEERFRRLSSVTYEGILIHNKGVAVDANESLATMFGYSREELTGQDMIELLIPCEYHTLIKENIVKAIASPYEVMGRKKNGALFPVEIESRNVIGEKENFRVTALRDITSRKLAAAVLKESEDKFKSLVEKSANGIFTSNNQQEFTFVNQAMCEILGCPESEIVGSSFQKFLNEESLQLVIERNKKRLQGQQIPSRYEFSIVRMNGEERMVEVSSAAIHNSEGRPVTIGHLTDITDRKRAETDRLELEIQLHQKHKMEAVGLMAGGMAHNFNNNLAIILGNLEMAQRKISEPEKAKNYIDNAKTASLRSRDLVQQIQIYSRNTKNETIPVLLPQIIKETIKLLRSTLPSTVNLQQTRSCDVTIDADPSQLQEVLINLCNNAIYAMDEKGNLTVSLDVVELKQEDIPVQYPCSAGSYAKISVQDTGSGMTAETQEKIFDPFFTTKELNKGTGMGLSTVQGIIDQHSGLIKVTSELDVGTTFDLYFPVTERREEERDLTVASLPTGTEKILFLDDEKMLADIWSKMLREYGYQVTTVTNSTKALELFKENPEQFDLVISDQTMPELSGKEFFKELLSIRPELPTILCTGHTTKINEKEARQIGIKAFCMKPLDLPTLLQTTRQILDEDKY